MRRLRVADLFCGAGGLSLGLRMAGFEPVFAADFDRHACSTYARNLGAHVHNLDLAQTEPEELADLVTRECGGADVVAGGAPCQGFSVQRRGAPIDARNDLVLRFGKFATTLNPQAIVLENVPTILGQRGKAYLDRVVQEWDTAGYEVHRAVLEAAAYGVPQFRRRAFVVGIRRDLGTHFQFPSPRLKPGQYVTVRDAIGNLPPPPEDFSEHPGHPNHRRVAVSEINLERLRHVPEGGGRLDVPARLQLPCHRNPNGHRHLDVFGRLWWDRPSGTLTAMFDNFTRGRFAHPEQTRNITGREGARLQSFPDDFVFLGPKKDVARQIGNAVAPLMAKAVGEALLHALAYPGRAVEQPRQRVLAL
jgi:DNA (cytosine-5)-methyltransferase 1